MMFWTDKKLSVTQAAVKPAERISLTAPASSKAIAFGVSQPLTALSVKTSTRPEGKLNVREIDPITKGQKLPIYSSSASKAPIIARTSAVPMPTPVLSFEGLSNYDNIAAYGAVIVPPDMNGDVGPDHYVQAVNALIRIYDKAGSPVTQPIKMSSIFAPLGTACSSRDDGLPMVQYDQLADRWLLSQYCNNFPPFRQLIAISRTGDPTGQYYLWEFVMPNIRLNDMAAFGVWPDGYYMSDEEFTGGDFAGVGMFAFDRAKMLSGDPSASYIYFNIPSATTDRKRNMQPSDLDGSRPPSAGSPNVFLSYTADEYGDSQDALRLFDFHADFANPVNSIFTERDESPLVVAAFDPTSLDGRMDIIQPAPGDFLDSNSDRLSYRAAYRELGDSASIVVDQTVRTADGAPYRGGVRVHQLKRTGNGPFAVAESSTIGDASSTRWIGGVAQDNNGNIALSYNYVSDTVPPAIRYTGKLATDPQGVFRTEGSVIEGTGVQRAFGWRWGDHNSINIDPKDDCTFWTTGEYYTLESQDFSEFTWLTRIAAFRFDECIAMPKATLTGSVINAVTGQPIEGAMVTAADYSRGTETSGSYGMLTMVPGSYVVTAKASGYRQQSVNITVTDGQVLTQNFALTPIPVISNATISLTGESCPLDGAADPGENVAVSVTLRNHGTLTTSALTVTLLNQTGVTNAGPAQNFGALPADGSPVTRTFTFTVDPSWVCGTALTLTFHLQDGGNDLGSITAALPTGQPKIAFQQNFDRSMQAQLPKRWTRSITNGGLNPYISIKHSTSWTKSLFSPDSNQVGVNEMATPVFRILTADARVTFQHYYDIETTFLLNRRYDGAVLEIKIGGGEWTDLLTAGGIFESGGYDGPIDACCNNPFANRPGWSGRSGIDATPQWVTVSARLPQNAAGQLVQLRWRMGTDVGNSRLVEGEFIDDLTVTDGYICGCEN